MKLTILSRCMGLLAISSLLAAANVYAKEDEGSSKQQSKESQQQQQAQASEKSKEELKISPEQLSKNVTDANKASKIIGMHVKNMQNEDLGKVKELVIDSQSGKVAYAVLSAGGGLLGGGKMVAVPFEALSLQPGAKNLVMNIKKDELKNAKGFAENNWPSLDAVKAGQTVGIATRGEQGQQQKEAVGGTGSDAQKSQGSQSSTNQQSTGSSEQPQPSKSDDSSVTNSAGSTGSTSSNTSGSSDSSNSNSSSSNSSSSNSSNSNNSSDSSK